MSVHAVEDQLRAAGAVPMRFGPTTNTAVDAARVAENLHMIHVEVDAPGPSRLERLLRRLGVDDLDIPLVTATPSLRRSWVIAVILAVLFALSASNNDGEGVDRIVVFLTLAPLVPLAGVALAFGRSVDPTHDLVLAAPRDTFRVFLIRSITVLVASTILLVMASALLRSGGAFRFAWLLPAMALTTCTMALSVGRDPVRVALGLAAGWITLVIVGVQATSAAELFAAPFQVVSAMVACAAAWVLRARRGHLEPMGQR